ncbi:MAG: sulfite exporter TauE/SafE family protein [Deltaproteobacteria bacterium]|nr:sulfite exporter TauE/SafE family protein [Deltaproteobacteria bacterium]
MSLGFIITLSGVFVIAALMAMTGRGGGNFYVPLLAAGGAPTHQAATTGQCILFSTAVAASLVFQKNRTIDWKLAVIIDLPTALMALIGGYYAHLLPGGSLKLIFAGLLVIVGFLMFQAVGEQSFSRRKRFGFWQRKFGKYEYTVNLWLALPITAATGLVAGMAGISGGSFKVPLMVLACGVPMRITVGILSAMVAATALMGFIGHSAAGDFNASWVIPMSGSAVIGGLVGGAFSLNTKPESLKKIFAYTTLGAAAFMILNSCLLAGN